jgi:predicted DsbA family dithiol-disulfide isomerase
MILRKLFTALLLGTLGLASCQGQPNKKTMNDSKLKQNPLLCDPDTGMCELPVKEGMDSATEVTNEDKKRVRIVYFTDPICSSCWGIEPQLRKLKLEYGEEVDIEYRMGGLLPDWSYNSGGISKPSDVAKHWDEVSSYYDMPIDGDVWLEDPLHSSYPPSIAFKAAQLQDEIKAGLFLREIREMVFLQKKNIAKWEHLATAAKQVGLDVDRLKTDFEGKAKQLFEEDLKLARQYGVRGFPTMFFMGKADEREVVYGSKPYAAFEKALKKVKLLATKKEYDRGWKSLFKKYSSLTAREFSELSVTPREEAEKLLNDLSAKGKLQMFTTKNGAIWTLK